MTLVVAIYLAVFLLPTGWGIAAILTGMVIEVGEAAFWIRLSRRRRPATGAEALVGAIAVAASDCRPEGQVRVDGELWRAICADGANAGDELVVESIAGLTLHVRPRA